MERLVAKAKQKLRKARNPWAKVKGPASAMVASCRRLGWIVVNSTELRTDRGETLQLNLDSPAAAKLEIARVVKRWRWRNVEAKMPQLKKGGSGMGALMEPITKLLKSRATSEDWNPALRGALRSAIAGRQYPQARVFAAGWSVHNKCLFCLHQLATAGSSSIRRTRVHGKSKPHVVISDDVPVPGETPSRRQDRARHKVEATAEQVAAAPVGTLGHRIWRCQSEWMTKLRSKWASPDDIAIANQCNVEGHPRLGKSTRAETLQANGRGIQGSDVQMGRGT